MNTLTSVSKKPGALHLVLNLAAANWVSSHGHMERTAFRLVVLVAAFAIVTVVGGCPGDSKPLGGGQELPPSNNCVPPRNSPPDGFCVEVQDVHPDGSVSPTQRGLSWKPMAQGRPAPGNTPPHAASR
jgi:hypothetical protein